MAPYLSMKLRHRITRFSDRPTLRALSLTSRDWLFPAQVMLFDVLSVTLWNNRMLKQLNDFLSSSYRLQCYVTKLGLFGADSNGPTATNLRVEDIFYLLEVLPRTRRLIIDTCLILGPSSAIRTPALSSPASGFKLVLSRSTAEKAGLHTLLTRLPVTELHIESLHLKLSGKSRQLFQPHMFKSVRTFNLGRVTTGYAKKPKWLMSDVLTVCHGNLKTFGFSFDTFRPSYGETVHQFLRSKGSQIKCLNVGWTRMNMTGHEADDIGVSHLLDTHRKAHLRA